MNRLFIKIDKRNKNRNNIYIYIKEIEKKIEKRINIDDLYSL